MLTGPTTPSNLGNWYPDLGATHHVTHDPSVLVDGVSLTSADQIHVGNGQRLPIHSIGTTLIPYTQTPHINLVLKNLLLVPSITKNLISVSKFARDNKVFFEFHDTYCVVKSLGTSEVLLCGSVDEDGLYSFDGLHSSNLSKQLSVFTISSPSGLATSSFLKM